MDEGLGILDKVVSVLVAAVLGLYGMFFKHVSNKNAHYIETPEGNQRPVTMEFCNQRYMEHEKASVRQEKTQQEIIKKLDALIESVARLEAKQ